MKIAIVVQRYGSEVCGGAEVYARSLAEHLAKFHEVEVITTTALYYSTWKPFYREGVETVNAVAVRRFHASPRGNRIFYGALYRYITRFPHPRFLEKVWLKANGPYCAQLLSYISSSKESFDLFIFVNYFFATTYFGLPLVSGKAVLVSTAHDDEILRFGVFRDFFSLPSAVVCLSPEEKNLIDRVFPDTAGRSEIIGMGVDRGEEMKREDLFTALPRLKEKEYVLYVGRISRGKGAYELLHFFQRFLEAEQRDLYLVMAGVADKPVHLSHPKIVLPGFVPDSEKAALIRNSRVVINPSCLESLSLVLLESWLMEVPVLVNGNCGVLRGQVERSGGGALYTDFDSFRRNLSALLDDREKAGQLAASGHAYARLNYSWQAIEEKFDHFLKRIAGKDAGISTHSS